MLEMLYQGGILMIPLIICSVLALTIILERAINLRRKKIVKSEIVNVIENLKSYDDLKLATSICKSKPGTFSNVVNIALENKNLPKEELKEAITEAGRQEVRVLERGLGVLGTIAEVSPLLGLLGTVLGMIRVFTVISVEGIGQASSLSGGISEALITTATGLSIGIPALVAYNYFTNKAESLITEIEHYSSVLLSKLHRFQVESEEVDLSPLPSKIAGGEKIR